MRRVGGPWTDHEVLADDRIQRMSLAVPVFASRKLLGEEDLLIEVLHLRCHGSRDGLDDVLRAELRLADSLAARAARLLDRLELPAL